MPAPIRIAISTCPNDTFAFHHLIHGQIETPGIDLEFEYLDIEQLNRGLLDETYDVVKASYAAASFAADRYWVLPSGSALGFGVGPLLLAAQSDSPPSSESQLALCPGQHTTAHLLFQEFYGQTCRVEQVVFSDIMPRLVDGSADFGVCIHEGRFTWEHSGLCLVADLGARWESATNCPLPLGGIFASRRLATDTIAQIQNAIRASLEMALANRQAPLPTMRHFAQEFDDAVLMKHVDLYVNEWTLDLGAIGRDAVQKLSLACDSGAGGTADGGLEIFAG